MTTTQQSKIGALDMALAAGDEDAVLLAFKAGRQRGLDAVIGHALTQGPDEWETLYVDAQAAGEQPEVDPGDRFEILAQRFPAPTKQDILAQGQPGINVSGMLR